MKIVTTSYINTAEYNEPLAWLDRINFHTGTLEELAKKHEVVSIEQINYDGQVSRNGVAYHFLNFNKPKIYFPKKLHRYIQKLQPDAVIVHGLHFPLQVLQLRRRLGKRVRIIVQNHAEKPQTSWRRQLQQLADGAVDAYLFTSTEMGQVWVKERIISSERKIAEVMEASSVFTAMNEKKKANSFLWVGRLNKNKDPETVVKAFLRFAETEPTATLNMIYGEDELLPVLKKLVKESGREDAVHFVGKLPHHQLGGWLNEAEFVVSGSHYEGSGIAVCEALSCGCIPVLTNIASFRKMTDNKSCGLLYEAGNEDSLFQALQKAVTMNKGDERKKVLTQFNEHLSFNAIANKMHEVITNLHR